MAGTDLGVLPDILHKIAVPGVVNMAAGPLAGWIKNIVVMCALSWILGYLVFLLEGIANTIGLGVDAVNTITWISWIFLALPFLLFLMYGINYWVESNNQSTGRV